MCRKCVRYRLLLLQAMRTLETELQRFRSTYIILSGYLDDAAAKIQDMWSCVSLVTWHSELTLCNFYHAVLLQRMVHMLPSFWLSVCLSICLSHSWALSNWLQTWPAGTKHVILVYCQPRPWQKLDRLDDWHVRFAYLCCVL